MTGSGTVWARYTYDAWGKQLQVLNGENKPLGSSSDYFANANPFRYRGYYCDVETGFYYLQSRYYDPNIGRFINSDSLVVTNITLERCNLFSYCGNNPVNYSDPSGMAPRWVFQGVEYVYDGSVRDFRRLNDGLPPYAYTKAVNDYYNAVYHTTSVTSNSTARGTSISLNYSSKESAKDFISSYYDSTAGSELTGLCLDGLSTGLFLLASVPGGVSFGIGTLAGIGIRVHNMGNYAQRDDMRTAISEMETEQVTIVITVWDTGDTYLTAYERE